MRTGVSCPHRTCHAIRHSRGRIPSRQHSCTCHRGGDLFESELALEITSAVASWWLTASNGPGAAMLGVTCLALAGSVRVRSAGGVRSFGMLCCLQLHNRPQCGFGLKWLDLDHPRCPACGSGAFLLDYACVEAGSCLYLQPIPVGLVWAKYLPDRGFLKARRGVYVLLGSQLPPRGPKPNRK